jgi:hypothetical protein
MDQEVSPVGVSKKRRITDALLPVFFFALFFGAMAAFYDYYREFFHTSAYSRRLSHELVEHDTWYTILRRFSLGAGAGSFFGVLTFLRSRENENAP